MLALSVGLIGCGGEEVPEVVEHTRTVSSTEGGSVTSPGEPGPYTYDFVSYSGLTVDGLGNPVATTDNGGVIYASYYRCLALNETDEDCYADNHPDVVSPADGTVIPCDPSECGNVLFTIVWDPLCDAQRYDIQFALDADFVSTLEDVSETGYLPSAPDMPNYVVPGVTFSCETTYYWRVRAAKADNGQVIHSLWSEPRQFTVGVGPGRGLELGTPEPGATDAPITNIAFVWDSEAAFDSYDWVLSENADLSAPVATATGLTTKAYTFTGSLKYDTVYFWQVSAYWWNGALMSSSGIGTFYTVTEPAGPPPAGCFIATAAYGTPTAKEIQTLREFRDEYLLGNPLGQGLVDVYYTISPPIADFVTEHPSLKPIVRSGLLPIVVMSAVALNASPVEKMAIAGSLVLVSVAVAVWAKRRRQRGTQHTSG
jgi:hypothetical protein